MDALTRAALAVALAEAMAVAARTPMVWGRDDCGLWMAGIVGKATGRDPATPWRGRYRTAEGAAEVLGPLGLAGAVRRAARACGWQKIAVPMARVGDVGLLRTGAGAACAVRGPGRFWIARGAAGWAAVPDARISHAWCVA